jgi:hypothetical protein
MLLEERSNPKAGTKSCRRAGSSSNFRGGDSLSPRPKPCKLGDGFLGLLPAPVEHVSDITRLYIRKYGVPPANTRIFIRACQQVEGWECRGQMRLTDALVPARVWVLHGQRSSRTGGKKG